MELNKVEKLIQKATKYQRKKGKTISASQLGSELLEIYYSITQEPNDDVFEVGQSELGSIFHLGMEKAAANEPDLHIEQDYEYELENGWRLTGTIDMLEETENGIILHDYKLTKLYKGKQLKKVEEPSSESYFLQANTYRMLYEKTIGKTVISMVLDCFYKDANKLKGEPTYEAIKVPRIDDDTILRKAYGITTTLEAYINSNTEPDGCEDTWIRKQKDGSIIHSKCELYCAHKKYCHHFKKLKRGKTTLERTYGGW